MPDGVPERLVDAAIRLLAEQGPSAIKARTVAAATGLSTMAVYSHFGGIPELTTAVIERGFKDLDAAFRRLPVTDDPMADLALQALTCRRVAHDNPHLYDLMFGLSTRGTYRQQTESACASGRSHAFLDAYTQVLEACARLVNSGRIREQDPSRVAAQLWSFAHGFITLELAETFVGCDDPVKEILLALGVNVFVGLGDTRESAEASHEAAALAFAALPDR
ncbi:TetR/AcrR family transcriptional regulator [Mycolicibacterium sp. P9-64]|uniref:TetR/AcrR family transcriptional regulator n=1 Tax=Mycolicibacterium sp. P9-64 TaxID=2024612 RepID=UPI0011EF2D6C|nr:TetR/AcrR family transcriptional regulator [Mycolicibacterium sp. P9-64]KAA0085791.1 TetR/AcrR family transcriptional regulator [Mycolicibacterium sp. P9-64]